MMFYPVCIYTIKSAAVLKKAFAAGGTAAFTENRVWRTGANELSKAKEASLDMLILFGASEEERGIIYGGVLCGIDIDEAKKTTKYSVSLLYKFDNPKPLSRLTVFGTGRPLSDNYIRPYAVVNLPQELDDWINEEGTSALKRVKKTGKERFSFNGEMTGPTVTDFWRWAYSDLCENTARGVLAEYIVAAALGVQEGMQENWKAYDLDYRGLKIEVKSSAYLQSWWQRRPSSIIFRIKETKAYGSATNTLADVSKRQSDIYVFCLLKHRIKETLDPLKLEQWRFYIVETSVLDMLHKNKKTLSLTQIEAMKYAACDFDTLKEKIDGLHIKS